MVRKLNNDTSLKTIQERLICLAKEAQKNSYSPFSSFPVGAALITDKNEFYAGCNIENVSYGLSMCAERVAVFKMLSEQGPQAKIKVILVIAKDNIPCSPCGACRQVIYEFCTPETIIYYMDEGEYVKISISQLLPNAFKF